MKWITAIVPLIACTAIFAGTNKDRSDHNNHGSYLPSDSIKKEVTLASYVSADRMSARSYTLNDINFILQENRITQFLLGRSQQGRVINGFYFPGISKQRALVIGGVHGSELSSIEIAYQLMNQLLQNGQPYYSVIVIPSLFPDNAVKATDDPVHIGGVANIGRYTFPASVDPNRQMPSPGKAYDERTGKDHVGREIETENQLLLQLIQSFGPQRIINIHAIRNTDYGGVYADPRTDHNGIALGYRSDSSLALNIAAYIHDRGGNVEGNNLSKKPTALYYKDPTPAPIGSFQKRNMTGSVLNANRGSGVSLGTWASTAIANEEDLSKNRNAMRIITMEYPGYKRPVDYQTSSEQLYQEKQIELFASAIHKIFLGNYFTEYKTNDLAKK